MQMTFEYRSYCIRREGKTFIASPKDGEGGELAGADLNRLLQRIDQLWSSLEQSVDRRPLWVQQLMHKGAERAYPDRFYAIRRMAIVYPMASIAATLLFLFCLPVLDLDSDGKVALADIHMGLDRLFAPEGKTLYVKAKTGVVEKVILRPSHEKGVNYAVIERSPRSGYFPSPTNSHQP